MSRRGTAIGDICAKDISAAEPLGLSRVSFTKEVHGELKRFLQAFLWVAAASLLFTSPAMADVKLHVANASFEEESADGSIPGWSQTVGSGSIRLAKDRSVHGKKSIFIDDRSSEASYGLESDPVPVKAGETYRAEVYSSAEESRGLVYLRFYDESGTRLAQTNVPTAYGSAWSLTRVQAAAPEGASYATVLLYSAVATIASVYFDDVSFYHVTGDGGMLEPVRLGTPIESVVIPHAAYGQGPNGENWAYVVTNGNPSSILTVLDVETGERVEAFALEGANYAWGNTTDPNGHVYMGSQRNGYLYRYVPGSGTVENLGRAVAGETHLWRIVSDEQGNIYGGTYPNGKVFRYDPVTESFTDYGPMADGEKYIRSIAYGNGLVYAGTGAVNAQLIALDPETGVKTPIPLPEAYRNQEFIYDLTFTEGFLFARITAHDSTSSIHNHVLVYDTTKEEWVDVLPPSLGIDVSPARNGKVYLWVDEHLYAYDLRTLELEPTSFYIGMTATRGFGWYTLNQEKFPGESLVFSSSRGDLYIYNPQTDKGNIVKGDPKGAAVTARSLHTGPDGNIYIGGYLSPNAIGVYDVERDRLEQWAGMGQIEGMGNAHGYMYMGVYPNAAIYQYDPAKPWDETKQVNPVELDIPLAEYGQDRPFAVIEAGEQAAIGTVPQVGKLGGALALYDVETGETRVYANLIEDESIMSLAYRDGLIYGGTSVWGGVSSEPTQEDATLFIFDPASEEVLFEMNPLPGERAITSLVFDEEGVLWGITNGVVFTFDPKTREVLRTKQLYPYEWTEIVLAAGTLNFYEGKLYGEAVTHIFEMDPKTWEHRTIGRGNYFAQDRYGRIYTIMNSTELIRYDVDAAAPITEDDARDGWYNAPATIRLTAVDHGSGVAATYYRVLTEESDGSEPFIEGDTVVLSDDGEFVLEYYSADAYGNKEEVKTAAVRIDQTAPEMILPEIVTIYPYEALEIDIAVTDALSGVKHVQAEFDGETVTDAVYRAPLTMPLGTYVLEASAEDAAGNTARAETAVEVILDLDHVDELMVHLAASGADINNPVTRVIIMKLYEAAEAERPENAFQAVENMIRVQNGKALDPVFAEYLLQLIDRLRGSM